ncbi:unnamed protein product [Cochlearia groenlandica]
MHPWSNDSEFVGLIFGVSRRGSLVIMYSDHRLLSFGVYVIEGLFHHLVIIRFGQWVFSSPGPRDRGFGGYNGLYSVHEGEWCLARCSARSVSVGPEHSF